MAEETWETGTLSMQNRSDARDTTLELGVALEALNIKNPEEARFYLRILENDQELERFPPYGFFEISVDPWSLDVDEWMV